MSDTPSRQRWIALFVLLMTFGSGALVGMMMERTLFAPEPVPVRGFRPPGGPGALDGPGRVFDRGVNFVQELDLSDDQRARIDSILTAERDKADAVLRDMRPRLQARYDSTTAAIMGVLTPEQRESFDSLAAERRDRIRERFGAGPPGRPGRGPR